MKKRTVVLTVLVCLVFSVLTAGFAAENPAGGTKQAICPVMAGKIDKNVHADYKGKRIYFCCSGCLDEFNKDPEKYMKAMEKEGVTLEKTP